MSNELKSSSIGSTDYEEESDKVVMLRLAPNLQKLSKLNLMNIQKEDSELKDQTLKSISTTDIETSVKEQVQDVSSGNYIDVFGSMQCPEQLQNAIRDIE